MEDTTEVRTDGNSLLKAVYMSRLRLTRLLLEGGAYINESNENGETPLMVACKSHHTDSQSVPKPKMVRYLLESGADPNIQDKSGKTALMHACLERVGTDVVSLLLSSGADPTIEDHAGLSALIHAVNTSNREVLRVLLDACKAKGKEVIIIVTNKLPTGHHTAKQYLNVPPLADLEERLHANLTPCCNPLNEVEAQAPARSSSASASPQSGSPRLGLRDSAQVASQPASPIQHPGPMCGLGSSKRHHLQRLLSEQWSKSPSLLLQQSQASSLTEEPPQVMTEGELSFRVNSHTFLGRPPPVSRHHSVDVKDTTGLLKTLENRSGNENERKAWKRGFGRKMSYDSSTSALHSASHPNLHQDSFPFPHEPGPADEDSPDCLRHLNVSSLQNVVRRRNIGIDHYSSDSQLPQFGRPDSGNKERHRLIYSRSSPLSESRESLESSHQRRGAVGQERRGSGALLLDHIAHTRPGYLPPLNPHAPIPDIGVSSSSSHLLSEISKTLNSGFAGSKPVPPSAPNILRDLKGSKVMWRRHSMQSEQIKQLVEFKECFGH